MTAAKRKQSLSTSVLIPGFRWNTNNEWAREALDVLNWYKVNTPDYDQVGGAGRLFADALLKFGKRKLKPIPSEAAIMQALTRIENNQSETLNQILAALNSMNMGDYVNKDGRSFQDEFDAHSAELIENASSNITGRTFNVDDED